MKADAQTEAEIQETLAGFMQAYEKRDMDEVLGYVSQDDDLVLFGTGKDEVRVGLDEFTYQMERDWSQLDSLSFDMTWQHVSAAGPVAWIAAQGQGRGQVQGQEMEFPFRMTAVMEKRGDRWVMVQSHLSLPAPEQEEGSSTPV